MAQKSRTAQLNGLTSLAYVGVLPSSPTNFFIKQGAPTTNDYRNCYVGDMWLDNSSMYLTPSTPPTILNLWILSSVANKTATWVNFGVSTSGDVTTLTGNDGIPVGPTLGNINVVGDGITISITGDPLTSTLTASVIGSLGNNSSFLYIQDANVTNVTGDGTIYQLGDGAVVAVLLAHNERVGGDEVPCARLCQQIIIQQIIIILITAK